MSARLGTTNYSFRLLMIPLVSAALLALTGSTARAVTPDPGLCAGGNAIYCETPVKPTPTPQKSVTLKFPKKCVKRDFEVRPTYSGGTVLWTKLKVGKLTMHKLVGAPIRFTVLIRLFKKGRRQNATLTTVFTDGTRIIAKGSFTRCR